VVLPAAAAPVAGIPSRFRAAAWLLRPPGNARRAPAESTRSRRRRWRDLRLGAGRPYLRLAIYDLLGALFAPSDATPVSFHTDRLFARVCSIVKARFTDPDLGPCEVAAEAGISLRYLQKLFTARGSTCGQYISSIRLENAARLLQRCASMKTGQPLGGIAYACGFRDYTHFARGFRRRFGCAPGASRLTASAGRSDSRCRGS
jgi:AraC-like DNA-binding protein